jgi:hypothetical protein
MTKTIITKSGKTYRKSLWMPSLSKEFEGIFIEDKTNKENAFC